MYKGILVINSNTKIRYTDWEKVMKKNKRTGPSIRDFRVETFRLLSMNW